MVKTHTWDVTIEEGTYSLTIFNFPISGHGTCYVHEDYFGNNCSANSCTYAGYPVNQQVHLTAYNVGNFVFDHWGGACTGTDPNSCTVIMDGDKGVSAYWKPTFDLTIFNMPIGEYGQSYVTEDYYDTNCYQASCTYKIPQNQTVNLTAHPATGYVLSSWSGACSGNTTCQVVMDGNKGVTANWAYGTIALLLDTSTYDGGPFPKSTTQTIATLDIKNDGTLDGIIMWRVYAHANQPTEVLLTSGSQAVPSGSTISKDMVVTLPAETGTYPFGVKVKGQYEPWPDWGEVLSARIFGGETGKFALEY